MKKSLLIITLIAAWCCADAQTITYPAAIKKADSLRRKKDYTGAAAAYSFAFRLNKGLDDPDERYNAACVWALANLPDSAFANLNIIVGKSYFDEEHLKTDDDLKSLRTDSRWQPMLAKTREAKLRDISVADMNKDLDILVSSLKEAHTGLYWYSTKAQFDSICTARRSLIKPGMNVLDFYNIAAPIVGFTKEGHTSIKPGPETTAYLTLNGKYLPLYLKFIDRKPYIINDVDGFKTKGLILTKINGNGMDQIMQKFLSYEPSDGYNMTGKYRWIEENAKFSAYYAMGYPQTSLFDVEVSDPATGKISAIKGIHAVSRAEYKKQYKAIADAIPNVTYKLPATLKIDNDTQTATFTFNSFDDGEYDDADMDFHKFVKNAFDQIKQQKVKHLIFDIRNNGGGAEGYEDYVLSFMIDKDYTKYKYVQASAFNYTFLQYTNYQSKPQRLETMLQRQHYLSDDGRILRKPNVLPHELPQPDPFTGDIYVLTSGLTYSGGSEFAALMHNYTNAKFIGEETGGGYYGNTSGNRILLTLPNSKLIIGIPILKFVLDTPKTDEPKGHGVMPDYPVQPTISQFLNGEDVQMAFVKGLIKKG